jgi:hypothetical protein
MTIKCPCDLSGTSECSPLRCENPQPVGYTEEQIRTALQRSGLEATYLIAPFWQALKRLKYGDSKV